MGPCNRSKPEECWCDVWRTWHMSLRRSVHVEPNHKLSGGLLYAANRWKVMLVVVWERPSPSQSWCPAATGGETARCRSARAYANRSRAQEKNRLVRKPERPGGRRLVERLGRVGWVP